MESSIKVVTGVVQETTTIPIQGWIIIIFLFIMVCFFFWRWQSELYTRKHLQKQLDKQFHKNFKKSYENALNQQNKRNLKKE